MIEILALLSYTAVPNLLMALGALMLMLVTVERRVAAVLGAVLLLLGVGISLTPGSMPSADRSSQPAPARLPASPSGSEVAPAERLAPSRTIDTSRRAEPEDGPTDCTAKITDLDLDAAAPEGAMEDLLYDGFLTRLMPSVELLPCATRHVSSRPLAARAIAASGGRAQTDALRILAGGGVAGLERTYGRNCTHVLSKDEVPVARVRVLKFASVAAAAAWDSLPREAGVDALEVSETEGRWAAWFRDSCNGFQVAVFEQEVRTGNVVIVIEIYTGLEASAEILLEKYSDLLVMDVVGRMRVK